MSEEWGPWIEHDGRGCPCVGKMVQTESIGLGVMTHIAGGLSINVISGRQVPFNASAPSAWEWVLPLYGDVVRYRIRKPKGLTILENLLADLPAPSKPRVDA